MASDGLSWPPSTLGRQVRSGSGRRVSGCTAPAGAAILASSSRRAQPGARAWSSGAHACRLLCPAVGRRAVADLRMSHKARERRLCTNISAPFIRHDISTVMCALSGIWRGATGRRGTSARDAADQRARPTRPAPVRTANRPAGCAPREKVGCIGKRQWHRRVWLPKDARKPCVLL